MRIINVTLWFIAVFIVSFPSSGYAQQDLADYSIEVQNWAYSISIWAADASKTEYRYMSDDLRDEGIKLSLQAVPFTIKSPEILQQILNNPDIRENTEIFNAFTYLSNEYKTIQNGHDFLHVALNVQDPQELEMIELRRDLFELSLAFTSFLYGRPGVAYYLETTFLP